MVSDTVDYVHLRYASPEVIIAQGGETALTKSGQRHSLIWTDVWMLRQGKWQIVTSRFTELVGRRRSCSPARQVFAISTPLLTYRSLSSTVTPKA